MRLAAQRALVGLGYPLQWGKFRSSNRMPASTLKASVSRESMEVPEYLSLPRGALSKRNISLEQPFT